MPNRGDPDRKLGPQRETLVGSVERVTFRNADTGFAVLKVKARSRRDLVPVVGHAASISAGEFIHAVGVWLTDRTHGLQFKADLLKTTPPTTKEGMARYLGSDMVRGIGPKLAERIVDQFGLDTFEVIETDQAFRQAAAMSRSPTTPRPLCRWHSAASAAHTSGSSGQLLLACAMMLRRSVR
jgi:ATP-dependent exoDNAse (exonuclease V) alpha subunit